MLALPKLRRSGFVPQPFNRCVLVSIANPLDYTRLEPVLTSLRRERLSFLFIPGSRGVRNELIARFGEPAVIDPPWNNRLSSLIFLLTSRVRLLISLDGIDSLPRSLVKEAYMLGIGIAVIAAYLPDTQGIGAASFVDLWLPYAAAISAHPLAMKRLHFLMARRPPARSPLQMLVAAAMRKPAARRVLGARAQRIETLAGLKATLGHPGTILCLGNGPSCEDPALAHYPYDCLFRVNHRWRERGLYCDPHMVFTGQKRTLFSLRSKPIFAFQTRLAEAHLVTHQIFNPLCRRMQFITLERLGILGDLDCDGVRPTNGANMLATAVALNPERLIIAGIDLFEDPAGAYPGDDKTANDYVVAHDRSFELDFILRTLRQYRGELVILSKPLAAKWAAM